MNEQTKRISKNIAILLLSCSLLVLTFLTWFGRMQPGISQRRETVGDFLGGLFGRQDSAAERYVGYEEYEYTMRVLSPVQAAVRGGNGMSLYTDRTQVRELFERSGSVLTGAFSSASQPEAMTRYTFRKLLTGPHLFFDFIGQMPLDALAAVMDTQTASFVGYGARYLVLSAGTDGLTLAWMSADGQMYACETTVLSGEVSVLLEEYGVGDAQYAFETDDFAHLPDVYISSSRENPTVYLRTALVSENTSATGERLIQTVLEGFGYNPYATGGYLEPDHTRVYVEELRTMRLSPDGKLSFHSPGEDISPEELTAETVLVMINQAAALLDHMLSDMIGDVSLYVQEIAYDESIQRVVVSFGCCADGIPLELSDGYFVRLEYAGEELTGAYLTLESFMRLQQTDLLLPDTQAAAVTDVDCAVFELRYLMDRNGEYHAGWYYRHEEPQA